MTIAARTTLCAAACYAALYSILCWLRFDNFHAEIDLSYYLRLIWGMGHGHPDLPLVRAPHFLGLHLEPITWPLAALSALGAPMAPLLLVLQAAAVAALCWPAYRLGRRHLGEGPPALCAVAVALLYPTVTVATLHDFHPVTLAMAPLLGTIDALDEGRPRRALWLGALALCCREDIALQLGLLCLYWAVVCRRQRLAALLLLVALCGYFLVYLVLIQARFPAGFSSYRLHFAAIGAGSGRELLARLALHPGEVLRSLWTPDRLLYPWALLWPLLVLPLLRPWPLLLALPVLGINLLSAFPNVRTIESHYTTALVPGLLGAALIGAGRLRRWRLVPAALLCCCLIAHLLHGASPLSLASPRWRRQRLLADHDHAAIAAAVRAVPKGASVAAPPGPLAHLAERPRPTSPPDFTDGRPVDVTLEAR